MRPRRILFALGILWLLAGARADESRLQRPIMLDSNGSDLFVLDSAGTLHEFHITQTELKEYRRFSLASNFTATDMSYSLWDGRESLLIAGSQLDHGLVARYGLDGQILQTWTFRNICSGIDFAMVSGTTYVATSDSNEIYQLNPRGTESTYVGRIPGATKLGPLAFDEANHRIYVADVAVGAIYQYSIATRASEVLVSTLSAPTALSFDPATSRLYVADPGRRAIFTVDTRSRATSAVEFASDPLKSPYGMALVENGRIAVADYGADSILIFSDKGGLLFRFPSVK